MENQKMINLLGNAQNQPSKFRKINRIEIDDDHGKRLTRIAKLDLKL